MNKCWSSMMALAACGIAASASLDAPAFAFSQICYVGGSTDAPVEVRARPDRKARIVTRLAPLDLVRSENRDRNGWSYVFWSLDDDSIATASQSKRAGKGWIKHDDIRGECED